jgi:hypothetical protein
MRLLPPLRLRAAVLCSVFAAVIGLRAAPSADVDFHVLAFYTGKEDLAHISFVHEANPWFTALAAKHHFAYEATTDWSRLNRAELTHYQVVLFLDTRPEKPEQRAALQEYMEHGGAWMGFHFAAFALNDTKYPDNWPWYQNEFLGCGAYRSNTWRPTSAVLRVEAKNPVTKGLPATFKSAPNEWYRWQRDLRKDPNIQVLLSIDPSSFPLGTGPKPSEIWHDGDYPVVWANRKFRMVYVNMGHNDMDYEHGTNASLSSTFSSPEENRLILQSLLWLGGAKR